VSNHTASPVAFIVWGALAATMGAIGATYSFRHRSAMLRMGCGGIFFTTIGAVTMIVGIVLAVLGR
jgi:hypothetical protein